MITITTSYDQVFPHQSYLVWKTCDKKKYRLPSKNSRSHDKKSISAQ